MAFLAKRFLKIFVNQHGGPRAGTEGDEKGLECEQARDADQPRRPLSFCHPKSASVNLARMCFRTEE